MKKIKSSPPTNHKYAWVEIQIKLSNETKGRLAAIYRKTANKSNCHKTRGVRKKGGRIQGAGKQGEGNNIRKGDLSAGQFPG